MTTCKMALPKSSDYIRDFDPEWYLATYYSAVDTSVEEGNIGKFMSDTFHEFFSKGQYVEWFM